MTGGDATASVAATAPRIRGRAGRDSTSGAGRWVLAIVIAAAAAAAAIASWPQSRAATPAPARLAAHQGTPIALAGAISRTLGRDDPAYRVQRGAGVSAPFARNPAQGLRVSFAPTGTVHIAAEDAALGLRAELVTLDGRPFAFQTPSMQVRANSVLYSYRGLTERFTNGPVGLEQGFLVAPTAAVRDPGRLALTLAVSGDVRAVAANATGVVLRGPDAAVRYLGLQATDARGRRLPASLEVRHGSLVISVDAEGARYPVEIDPFVQQGSSLTNLEGGEIGMGAHFGSSVAVSGDGSTALVGAPLWANNQHNYYGFGAAFVFTRSGSTWTQQGSLIGTGIGDRQFGTSVALSDDGNTALIGAPGAAGLAGEAWIYTRSGGVWTQQGQPLTALGETGHASFGAGVALSGDGDTAMIGGPGALSGAGAVWVFTRSEGTWTQSGPALTASGEEGGGGFGASVALAEDGEQALIGAPAEDVDTGSAWAFERSAEGWTQVGSKLTPSEVAGSPSFGCSEHYGGPAFGTSVAISADGEAGLVGGPQDGEGAGAAWAFQRTGGGWLQEGAKISSPGGPGLACFGASVALSADGDAAIIGAPEEGKDLGGAWPFARSGGPWGQPCLKLSGPGESSKGFLGSSVAIGGSWGFVGAPSDVNSEKAVRGAAWTYEDQRVPATVTKVAPRQGSVAGRATVTVGALDAQCVTSVLFGSQPATGVKVLSAGSVRATAPAGAGPGTVDVRLVSPEGTSAITTADRFKYLPAVSAVAPSSGPAAGGTVVTISGQGFATGSTGTVFKFGSSKAKTLSCPTSTECTAVAPAHATGTVEVKVTVNKLTSAKNPPADDFTYE